MKTKPTSLYEEFFWQHNFTGVVGIDEAGAGPLAGPVVAAAVIFDSIPDHNDLVAINDSKALSASKREFLNEIIKKHCAYYAFGEASPREIDELNILQARLLAMRRALDKIEHCDAILIDGTFAIPRLNKLQCTVVGGDAKILSIAAASILAKVHRDNIMRKLDKKYPEYNFAQHMGYGTKLHRELLQKYGPSPIHRLSFLKNII
jgi:ribonuclease HII